MNSRAHILHQVRTALGRSEGQAAPELPPVRLSIPAVSVEARIASMIMRLEALAGRVYRVATPAAARAVVEETLANRTAVASNAPFLEECGIPQLPNVRSGIADRDQLREVCASAAVGISSADYGLADTGTLVMVSSPHEARMISLLPPTHIAVLPCSRLLTGLNQMFALLPSPASMTSSLVLITGPSRTADIEQILVRGVHGPGEIIVVLVG